METLVTDGLKIKNNKALLTPISRMKIQDRIANRFIKHGFSVAGDFLFYPAEQVSLISGIGKISIIQVKAFLKPWGGDFGALKSPWIDPLDYSDPIGLRQRALLDSYLESLHKDGDLNVLKTLPKGDAFFGIQTPGSRRLRREFLESVVTQSLGHKDKKIVDELMQSQGIEQAFGMAVSLTQMAIVEVCVNPSQKPETPSEPSQG